MFKEFMAQKLPFLQMTKKNSKKEDTDLPAQPEETSVAVAEPETAEQLPAAAELTEGAVPEEAEQPPEAAVSVPPEVPEQEEPLFMVPEASEIEEEEPLPAFMTAEDDFEAGMAACREKNYTEAVVPLLRAAEAGHKEAQFLYGQICQRGLAADPDPKQALTWFKRSAKQGYLHAQLACAVMYEEGTGTSVNIKRALHWYEQAAKQGAVEAQLKCGQMYYRGRAETRNPKKARIWLETAAGLGSEDARKLLSEYF